MVIYVVIMSNMLVSVWDTPEPAIEAKESCGSATAYVAVRPVNHTWDTEESKAARAALRQLEADRASQRG